MLYQKEERSVACCSQRVKLPERSRPTRHAIETPLEVEECRDVRYAPPFWVTQTLGGGDRTPAEGPTYYGMAKLLWDGPLTVGWPSAPSAQRPKG